jgi:hypothetical protein
MKRPMTCERHLHQAGKRCSFGIGSVGLLVLLDLACGGAGGHSSIPKLHALQALAYARYFVGAQYVIEY